MSDAASPKSIDGDRSVAFISLGSNLGEKAENCRKGIDALSREEGIVLTGLSRFYMTEPVDYRDQDWFVNAVARVATFLSPLSLLHALNRIETALGRRRDGIRFGPRVIDLDLLLYDALIIDVPGLTVPHPRLHKRRFVLTPMCDIDPERMHPVLKKTMRELSMMPEASAQNLIPLTLNG